METLEQMDLFHAKCLISKGSIKDHPLFSMLRTHIVDKFWEYHADNPRIFELYIRFARQLKASGRESYGAKAIAERIRWHIHVETKGDDFKMGNNHPSCYARLLAATYPDEFGEFFAFRHSPGTIPIEEH